MSPFTDAEAVKLFPSLEYLVLIRESGWTFLPIDDPGDPDAVLDAARVWPGGWRDCIRVRDEADALGLRIQVVSEQPAEIVWERSGTFAEVVHELLSLLPPTPADGAEPEPQTP